MSGIGRSRAGGEPAAQRLDLAFEAVQVGAP